MENNKYHILIVEDDKEIRDGVEIYLKNQGYQVWKAANGKEGLEIVAQEEIHLAILDIMMPVMDGVTMLMKLREQNHEFPVIMLSAKSEEVDRIMGLNMGADDYVTKPFSNRELQARVKALLRRSELSETQVDIEVPGGKEMVIGDLVILSDAFVAKKHGKELDLTHREFELLHHLANHLGQVMTRDHLLETVWGYDYFGDVRTVDVTIRRLREKIEDIPSRPEYILTRRGVGYYIKAND